MDEDLRNDRFSEFVEKSGYYSTAMHSKFCKICKLPPKVKQKINQMILDGVDHGIIETYLINQFPDIFKSKNKSNIKKTIDNHKQFLPFLIEDVKIKSIFKRARHIIKNKNIDDLSNEEKAKVITEIEEQLIQEYEDIENERISLLNVLFKDTLPLMITRLQEEIVVGKTRGIKEITDASNALWKMITAMAAVDSMMKEEEKEEMDFSKLDEEAGSKGSRAKIVSLKDSINKATKGIM